MAHHKKVRVALIMEETVSQKRLGIKRADGQLVLAGNILYRQKRNKMHPGTNVGIGSDDTLYAKVTGIMKEVEKNGKRQISKEN